MGGQDLNRVGVERDLWWDFNARGYTFRDRVRGELQQGWRLDMSPLRAAGCAEQRAAVFVTARDGHAGVEVRMPSLDLEATGRIEKPLRNCRPQAGTSA